MIPRLSPISTAIRAPTLVVMWHMYRTNVFDEMDIAEANELVIGPSHFAQRLVSGNDPLHPLEDLHRALDHEAMVFERLTVSALTLVVSH
ncbi:hypothetical protein Pcac1_g22449 [Phytophthora cactorum]|uniref:Uncharacterized protein n=1 Tax=Phytophthora cactorum TaxID=29920 RepID=A0A8T1CQH6_9STRA|nr:hypothetical protein Pcac1_g22449 [Phytophthora cactorum]KAG2929179.1 hypothetical protein PC117_g14065 [Phytophthora cactorum]KAG3009150.1 hypothetical protein PC119_g13998 [Phytophthora cactorum]